LVKEDCARNKWSLARIIRRKKSADGKVRSVTLITSKQKEIDRPIHKLVHIVESPPIEVNFSDIKTCLDGGECKCHKI